MRKESLDKDNMKPTTTGKAFVVWIGILIISISAASTATTNQTTSARVSEILLKFPAQSPAAKLSAAAEILALGEAGIEDVCRRLSPPGMADDSLARYALEAASDYAARPGAENDRRLYAKAVIKALKKAADPDVQAFLIRRLQMAGGAESVKPLGRYLSDATQGGPAAEALLAVGTPDAEKELVKALGRKDGKNTAAIIEALGELRSREAIPKILSFAASADSRVREMSLYALANIGDPRAEPVLSQIPVASSPTERARAASLYVLFARRAAELGRKDDALRISRSLLAKNLGADEGQVRSAALTLMAEILGDKVLSDLLQAMDSPDAAFRERALELSSAIPGEEVTAEWIGRAAEVSPEAQAQIVAMLGRREDPSALNFIRDRLRSEFSPVRIASIGAAARLGQTRVISDLAPIWQTANEQEAAALKAAFLGFPEDEALGTAVKAYPGASLPAKAAIIAILGERRAGDHAGIVLAGAANEDKAVRKSSVKALANVVRAQDLAQLIGLILASAEVDPADMGLLQDALAASARQIPDPEKRADLVVDAMQKEKSPKRLDLLRSLAKIGGHGARRAVLAEIQNPDPRVQAVAVYTLAGWPEFEAASDLLNIARKAGESGNRNFVFRALQGYVRLAGESGPSAENKLAMIKDALDIAREPAEKNLIIAGLGGIKAEESLRMLARFLDNPAYQDKAAQAVIRAALPSAGKSGLSGLDCAWILKRAAQFSENEYERDQIEKYANALLEAKGFTPLFNGKDLSGWKGLVKDPPARAKMSPETLKKEQAAADDDMRRHWQVIEDTLVFDGQGHSLCTDRDYADFELFVDWKIEPEGDSGIYLRGSPQVQIWDPAQHPEGSGGLYNNQAGPSAPLRPADHPVGEWNTFYIRMAGERVTGYLNNVLVVDNAVMENYWEREKPIYPSGQIELQAHSTPLHFKNIYIREIPAGQANRLLSEEEEAEGFVPLFNGSDLTGWVGDTKGYIVEDGKIVVDPERGSGNLYTASEYSDFVFRFEFKLTPGANNGLGIRAPLEGDAAYAGLEIQILDDTAPEYKDLKPYQYHGSVYGVVPAKRGFLKPVGEWNEEEVVVRGRRVTIKLNGVTIVDADLDQAATPQTLDGRDHPGLERERGHIGFLGHGSRLEFRRIRIKVL
jgi:HEAT repeat protein